VTVPEIMREHGLDRIDLLKVDIEGSEMEVFSHADAWIGSVDAISVELHDRFKPGCSSAFFKAVEDFPVRLERGEDVFTAREETMLRPPPAPSPRPSNPPVPAGRLTGGDRRLFAVRRVVSRLEGR
jgi:Methyltransferase FkbM domain